jgi:hypothetical protein
MINAFVFGENTPENSRLFEFIYHSRTMRFIGSSNILLNTLICFLSSKKPDVIFVDTSAHSAEWKVLFGVLKSKVAIVLITPKSVINSGVFEVYNIFYLDSSYKYCIHYFLECNSNRYNFL